MVSAESIRPSDLTSADRAAWAAFCAATPVLRSPLLGPDFAEAVARQRPDAFVAVLRRAGRAVGFLPHHRRPFGFARPIGAPFSDYHALVGEPGVRLDAREALEAAGLKTLRFTNLIDPAQAFGAAAQTADDGYVIRPGPGGVQAYLDGLRAANAKRAKNWRRLEHKLEREAGDVEFRADDRDREAFETLICWKRQQLTRTGLHDVFRPDWSLNLMRDVFERREGPFQGLMITLRAGGRLIAGHFGARLDGAFHSWVSAVDPAASALGPGNTLLLRAIAAMPALELERFDMGPGHGHYKEDFCAERVPCGAGVISTDGAYGPVAQSAQTALALVANRSDAAARLLRRMDHIAATELSIGGRLRGVVHAFAGQGRRTRALGACAEV